MENNNTYNYNFKINKQQRNKLKKHNSFLILFTGLSGSGKSTLANALENRLYNSDKHTYILDGDNLRSGLNKKLSFSAEDRSENNRRVGEISKLFIDAGIIVLASFIAPYSKDRDKIAQIVGKENYVEIFVNTSLKVCEKRDVKGLYKKVRNGEIKNFTGIDSPYEQPLNPDIEIKENNSVKKSIDEIYNYILPKINI